jgi:hypothetical protein
VQQTGTAVPPNDIQRLVSKIVEREPSPDDYVLSINYCYCEMLLETVFFKLIYFFFILIEIVVSSYSDAISIWS